MILIEYVSTEIAITRWNACAQAKIEKMHKKLVNWFLKISSQVYVVIHFLLVKHPPLNAKTHQQSASWACPFRHKTMYYI